MRRFYSDAMRHQDRLAEQADRPTGRTTSATGSDDSDLVPSTTAAENTRLRAAFAAGTKHTGTIIGRRASGFVLDFGSIKGILPFNKTGGANIGVGDRTKVTVVTGFDGSRAPQLTR